MAADSPASSDTRRFRDRRHRQSGSARTSPRLDPAPDRRFCLFDHQPSDSGHARRRERRSQPGRSSCGARRREDLLGQIHVRGEHNGLQYRLNGVILPEGLSVFGQALSPRLADTVDLITGALPAEYGLRTAGVIDITTKSGELQNGGDVSIYGGSHDEIQPSFEYRGSSGDLNVFVSGGYLHGALGIELRRQLHPAARRHRPVAGLRLSGGHPRSGVPGIPHRGGVEPALPDTQPGRPDPLPHVRAEWGRTAER